MHEKKKLTTNNPLTTILKVLIRAANRELGLLLGKAVFLVKNVRNESGLQGPQAKVFWKDIANLNPNHINIC